MEVLVIITLTLNIWACSGFPVYDYDPSMMRKALKASLEKVNSQSQNPNLFQAYKSSVRRVNFMNENDLTMDIDFKIRETECRKASENPPSTCDFKIGYYASTAFCRSTVEISSGQVQNVWVRCHHAFSSSESSSSEEIFGGRLGSYNWRNYYMRGIGDVEVFPPQSRRLQNDWNRYRAFE
ncbi:secreted phosphoprotein 24-like isoform X3 [Notamacropus eugenii]|uniref:secreted phosphoprotein 24-like isoform X3 n=1 Tax=Notamacropus eugenii TaxID=9315 RepID=UPI003B6739DD